MTKIQENEKPPLESRFQEFMKSLSGVQSIDELLAGRASQNQDRADYLAAESGLVIKLKSLESDTEWKVDRILKPHRERDEFPVFFGRWELSKILKHLSDGDDINRQIMQAVTTSVRAVFRKANGQVKQTKETFRIPQAQGLLVILNQNVEILTPEILWSTLGKIAHSKLDNGEFRYTEICAVLLISEAHGKELPGNTLGHPVLLMPFDNGNAFAHNDFVHKLTSGWADFNQTSLVDVEKKYKSTREFDFESVSELHKAKQRKVPRQEAWVRYYHWNPYLRRFDNEYLRWFIKMIMGEVGRGMIKGGTDTERERAKYFWMEVYTHFMEEVKHRGIDLRYFTSDERVWHEVDAIMESRFSDFVAPTREWADKWRKTSGP